MKTIRQFIYATLIVFMMGLPAAAEEKAAQQQPAGPVISLHATFPVTVPGGEYDLKTIVFDFQPGDVVPLHMHGGDVVATVLGGEITLREKGTSRVIKAGESWTEKAGDPHSAVNAGAAPARVVVTMLLPRGADATRMIKE